jgi:hypothetical protein
MATRRLQHVCSAHNSHGFLTPAQGSNFLPSPVKLLLKKFSHPHIRTVTDGVVFGVRRGVLCLLVKVNLRELFALDEACDWDGFARAGVIENKAEGSETKLRD